MFKKSGTGQRRAIVLPGLAVRRVLAAGDQDEQRDIRPGGLGVEQGAELFDDGGLEQFFRDDEAAGVDDVMLAEIAGGGDHLPRHLGVGQGVGEKVRDGTGRGEHQD